MKKVILLLLCVALLLAMLPACSQEVATTAPTTETPTTMAPTTAPLPPIEESYKYTTKSGYYLWPSMLDGTVERKVLIATTDDGTFYCMTTDKNQANDFIVAQRTLLRFLGQKGMQVSALKYYATDYDDSFSKSGDGAAYIAFSAVRSWQQVLVTLQTLLGDYTDYGYVWALSNAIAGEMGWTTSAAATVDQAAMDAFFAAEPAAVNLLYPNFTTLYASQQSVDCCQALAASLMKTMDWHATMAKPVEQQLESWYGLVTSYANSIAVSFNRQGIGYAYYSQRIPLRIMTQYAEHYVDAAFYDASSIHGDIFYNVEKIYETAHTFDQEISNVVARLDLKEAVGVLPIYWISGENAAQRFNPNFKLRYVSGRDGMYVSYPSLYMNGYYQHILAKADINLGRSWQSNALGELLRSESAFAQSGYASSFRDDERLAALFYKCTGHYYGEGTRDYFVVMDILCYVDGLFALNPSDPLAGATSIAGYLVKNYGEAETHLMLLGILDVKRATSKTWDELIVEWEQHIRATYAHVDVSEWANP